MRGVGALAVAALLLGAAGAEAQTAHDLFDGTTVHRLDLLVHSRDWEKLKANFELNDFYPADVRWNGLTVRNVGIRSRGFSTRRAEKPALRVDINRYATGQEFLGLKSFLLDNLATDPTGIKERLAMRFYERMGLPAPREAHVALYVNDEYAGLYAIIESIDKDFLARVFGERAPGDTENDGHLFEYTYVDPWRWEYLGHDLAAYSPRFNPKTHERSSAVELFEPIHELVRAVNESDFAASAAPRLDLPLVIRLLAIQNFLAEPDGILGFNGTANFYLYRFEESDRWHFIPWDEDRAFHSGDWPIFQFHDEYVLMRRAMADPSLRRAYLDTLLEAAEVALAPADDPAGAGWLEVEVARLRHQVAGLMHADARKPYSNDEHEAAMQALAAFPSQRAAFVRAEVGKAR